MADPDPEYVICPYNPSHEIMKNRFAKHLIKCRKSYTGPELSICPFNFKHQVPKEMFEQHLKECESLKANIQKEGFSVTDVPIETCSFQGLQTQESWEGYQGEGYDPARSYDTVGYVRKPPPAISKSAMKQFYEEENARLEGLKGNDKKAVIPGLAVAATPQKMPPGGLAAPKKMPPCGLAAPQKMPPGGLAAPQKMSPGGLAALQKMPPGGLAIDKDKNGNQFVEVIAKHASDDEMEFVEVVRRTKRINIKK